MMTTSESMLLIEVCRQKKCTHYDTRLVNLRAHVIWADC